jgi:hypothetical protein
MTNLLEDSNNKKSIFVGGTEIEQEDVAIANSVSSFLWLTG